MGSGPSSRRSKVGLYPCPVHSDLEQGDSVKQRKLKLQPSDRQQLLLGIVLVILLAVSMLYCLGFASMVLLQAWENATLPWNATDALEESIDLTATPVVEPADLSPALH
jgi:cytoskeletal protein RodZ